MIDSPESGADRLTLERSVPDRAALGARVSALPAPFAEAIHAIAAAGRTLHPDNRRALTKSERASADATLRANAYAVCDMLYGRGGDRE